MVYNICEVKNLTVYFDVLFLVNFIADYIIIFSTSKAGLINTNYFKIAFGALIGALYGMLVFEISGILSVLANLIVTLIIIYVVFSKIEPKTVALFYIISFIFGGISNYINNLYGVISVSNGFFYIENNISAVILGMLFSSFLLVFLINIIKRNFIKKRQIKLVEIVMDSKKTTVSGLWDTGNLLLDPITGYPVILVIYDRIEKILPDELKEFLKDERNLSSHLNRKYLSKIRLIPYRNSSSEDILKGFKPDYIVIKDKKDKVIKDVIIAVSHTALSKDDEFNAILNPQL